MTTPKKSYLDGMTFEQDVLFLEWLCVRVRLE